MKWLELSERVSAPRLISRPSHRCARALHSRWENFLPPTLSLHYIRTCTLVTLVQRTSHWQHCSFRARDKPSTVGLSLSATHTRVAIEREFKTFNANAFIMCYHLPIRGTLSHTKSAHKEAVFTDANAIIHLFLNNSLLRAQKCPKHWGQYLGVFTEWKLAQMVLSGLSTLDSCLLI